LCEPPRPPGFGAGGLGLSGIGEGGGGRGEGIGLGSIGTIGRGYGPGGDRKASGTMPSSTTNNQVEGVDEADIVKDAGRYVYLAPTGALRIVEAEHPRVLSVTRLTGNARNMLLEGDRAVVFTAIGGRNEHPCTYGYDCTFAGDGSRTRIVVYDVADRA